MFSLVLTLLGLLALGCSAQQPVCLKYEADIFFLLDTAEDVGQGELNAMITFVRTFVSRVNIGSDGVQVGLYTFSSFPTNQFYLLRNADQLASELSAVQANNGTRYTDRVLEFVALYGYSPSRNGRASAAKIAVLMTNGPPELPEQTKARAEQLKENNITIITIGIGDKVNSSELESIAFDPSYALTADNFLVLREADKEFSGAVLRAVERVCEKDSSAASPPTVSTPTVNGNWSEWSNWTSCSKTCGDGVQYRYRTCLTGAKTCNGSAREMLKCTKDPCSTACSTAQADIYFLLDSSDDVGPGNFILMLSFLKKFVDFETISLKDTLVGLFTISSIPKDWFHPNVYSLKSKLLGMFDRVTFGGGERSVALTLKSVRQYFSNPFGKDRPTAPNIAILIVNGEPLFPDLATIEAEALKQANVSLITIGIGDKVNTSDLESMASDPNYALTVDRFEVLNSVLKTLQAAVTAAVKNACDKDASPPTVSTPVVLPNSTTCKLKENIALGDIRSVTIYCSTDNVNPEAACSFYRKTDGGKRVAIKARPSYTHKSIQSSSGSSYRTECSVREEVSDLGEGTHTFHVFVYPNVTGGESLVNATMLDTNVTLSFPRATHNCPPTLVQDYLCGKPTTCNCTLISEGRPKGYALWFEGTIPILGPLVVSYDGTQTDVAYTCDGASSLGRVRGSRLEIGTETSCL